MESVSGFRKGTCGEESVTNNLEATSSPFKLVCLTKQKKVNISTFIEYQLYVKLC